uniref:Uncharacterized protein n=1 Tax=Aegilops tauschii TaxID=37682 RepID=N1R235_AEGTA
MAWIGSSQVANIPFYPSPFSGQAKALAAMDANEILDQGSPGPASSKNKMHPLIKIFACKTKRKYVDK